VRAASTFSVTEPDKPHPVTRKKGSGSVNTITLKVVCQTCNSGWMSLQETAVRPILTPLIQGQPITLNADSQRILAAWITMKLMVIEHSQPNDLSTPQAHRSFLFENKLPPTGWHIWLIKHSSEVWTNAYFRIANLMSLLSEGVVIPIDRSLPQNTQAQTLGIGQLAIQGISTSVSGLNFNVPPELRPTYRQVWPYEGDIIWPPLVTLNESDMVGVTDAFERYIRSTPMAPGVV